MKYFSSIIKRVLFVVLFLNAKSVSCQFAGPVGQISSTAIPINDPSIVSWGDSVSIVRGPQNISDINSPLVSFGSSDFALGQANSNVVSLGDGGSATYYFSAPIIDLPGFDFAIFENAFNDSFLELAFVEVSSDGIYFVRFPAVSNMQNATQIGPFDNQGDASLLNNLAGKYRVNYGTPFDLNELVFYPAINLQQIHYIRVIDVIGSVNNLYGSVDINSNLINDPFPTDFPTSGFDLDAVSIMHQAGLSLIDETIQRKIEVYPNPVQAGKNLMIFSSDEILELSLYDLQGRIILQSINSLQISSPEAGNYYLLIKSNSETSIKKIQVY